MYMYMYGEIIPVLGHMCVHFVIISHWECLVEYSSKVVIINHFFKSMYVQYCSSYIITLRILMFLYTHEGDWTKHDDDSNLEVKKGSLISNWQHL